MLRFRSFFSFALLSTSLTFAAPAPIQLSVDGTEASRNILHAKLRIPVEPGEVTLAYPKWLPGNHRPAGPVQNLTGLAIEAAGKRLEWRRDPVEMFSIHVMVPPGVHELDVALDAITDEGVAGSSGAAASTHVMDVNWNWVVLYPAQMDADAVQVSAKLRLPESWRYGTALEAESGDGNEVTFKTVSLTTLIDSPLIAGDHFVRLVLDRDHDPVEHVIDIAAESDSDLAIAPKDVSALNNLVSETGALFGARHYRHYDLLLTLSSQVGGRGLEHHESSDNAPGERFLLDENVHLLEGSLLSHEFTHSWNGKYRRPAGLATRNYQEPMRGDLLWVYEGLTNYLGNVLAARSGFWTEEQYRENLADTAARMESHRGREWRSLEDTAVSVQSLRLQGPAWANWRRGLDYYPEGELIWLEVDTKIRQFSGGKKSLDDFCRAFHGGESGAPKVVPYTFDDIVTGLNAVAPYDWAALLRQRVQAVSEHAPLAGIEGGGWKLVFTDKSNAYEKALASEAKIQDYTFSLGFTLDKTAKVVDVVMGSPAYRAGITPHMTLIAVNGRKFDPDRLKDAVAGAAKGSKLIALLMENAESYQTLTVDYSGGLRYPHLERVEGTQDVLGAIVKAKRK
jgi:predicted metalloprotease with PDZ domain